MSGFAGTQRDARQAWVSVYPFELAGGGLGVSLALTTTSGASSLTPLVGEGSQVLITNVGSVVAYLAFGNASIVATTAYVAIVPGLPYTLTIPEGTTHVAGIVSSSTTTVQITRGYGN